MPSFQAFHSLMAAFYLHSLVLDLLLLQDTHQLYTFSQPFLLSYYPSSCFTQVRRCGASLWSFNNSLDTIFNSFSLHHCPGKMCTWLYPTLSVLCLSWLDHGIHFKGLAIQWSESLYCAVIILYFCYIFFLPPSQIIIQHFLSPQISSKLSPSLITAILLTKKWKFPDIIHFGYIWNKLNKSILYNSFCVNI